MGNFLNALGKLAYKHPWLILGFWLIALAGLITTTTIFFKTPSSSISIPGTQAQRAIDHVGELFPKAGGSTGRIVIKVPSGDTIVHRQRQVESLIGDVAMT